MFKYELHTHAKEVSMCSKKSAKEMVETYKALGYQGLVVTDHFRQEYFKSLKETLSWEEKVNNFLKGYKEAVKAAKDLDFQVFLGIELGLFQGGYGNEFLIYGMTEEFLKHHSNLLSMSLEDIKKLVNESDMLLFQAHPLRSYCELQDTLLLDGVEVFNGNPRHDSRNNDINEIAISKGLRGVSGSDYHEDGDEGRGGILVSRKINTNKELVDLLRSQEYEVITNNSELQ